MHWPSQIGMLIWTNLWTTIAWLRLPLSHAKKKGKLGYDGVLGPAEDGVPAGLHAEMEALARAGEIPKTILEQRVRNKGSAGSTYAVEKELAAARQWGYISPNLPPPAGKIWRVRIGQWRLVPRGG